MPPITVRVPVLTHQKIPALKQRKVAAAANMLNLPTKKNILYWLPVVIYAGFIFSISSVPGKDIPGLFPYQDVVFHFLEYAVFALLITRAMKGCYTRMARVKRLLLVMALVLGYALLDEFHQSFVPGRTASLVDVATDVVGSFLAVCFL